MEFLKKKTTYIFLMLVLGLVLGMYGLIAQDYGTLAQANFRVFLMILGFTSFVAGWIWLWLIQPRK